MIAIVTFKKTGQRLAVMKARPGCCGPSLSDHGKCALYLRRDCAIASERMCMQALVYFKEAPPRDN